MVPPDSPCSEEHEESLERRNHTYRVPLFNEGLRTVVCWHPRLSKRVQGEPPCYDKASHARGIGQRPSTTDSNTSTNSCPCDLVVRSVPNISPTFSHSFSLFGLVGALRATENLPSLSTRRATSVPAEKSEDTARRERVSPHPSRHIESNISLLSSDEEGTQFQPGGVGKLTLRKKKNVKTYMLLQSFFISYDILLSLAKYILSTVRTSGYRKTDRSRVNCGVYGKTFRIEEGVTPPLFPKNCECVATRFFFYVFSLFAVTPFFQKLRTCRDTFFFLRIFFVRDIIFKYSRSDQAFRLAVRDHLVLPSQYMVISNQPGSARPVGSCQKFPWHGTRKNVMRENGPLFQHHHFLHDKFLVNDESLQIHERWHEHVVEKTAVEKTEVDCCVS
ncbi:hypothetical protein ALC57_15074 [Trachymyrmex cornetzi]|uniref:Uncharacterized protein n=1 Tax=Trachymyrmex cornetzi TaxID=471704 RepID=A0A151IXG3_9HYME|nr:hypothetical protein ALC57_15074 [Trachymyrmex cornetzi]